MPVWDRLKWVWSLFWLNILLPLLKKGVAAANMCLARTPSKLIGWCEQVRYYTCTYQHLQTAELVRYSPLHAGLTCVLVAPLNVVWILWRTGFTGWWLPMPVIICAAVFVTSCPIPRIVRFGGAWIVCNLLPVCGVSWPYYVLLFGILNVTFTGVVLHKILDLLHVECVFFRDRVADVYPKFIQQTAAGEKLYENFKNRNSWRFVGVYTTTKFFWIVQCTQSETPGSVYRYKVLLFKYISIPLLSVRLCAWILAELVWSGGYYLVWPLFVWVVGDPFGIFQNLKHAIVTATGRNFQFAWKQTKTPQEWARSPQMQAIHKELQHNPHYQAILKKAKKRGNK